MISEEKALNRSTDSSPVLPTGDAKFLCIDADEGDGGMHRGSLQIAFISQCSKTADGTGGKC